MYLLSGTPLDFKAYIWYNIIHKIYSKGVIDWKAIMAVPVRDAQKRPGELLAVMKPVQEHTAYAGKISNT